MRVRVNLPENYVVVDADTIQQARLEIVRATGVAVKDQGLAFTAGYIGYVDGDPMARVEYRHHVGPGSYFRTWVPEGAEFADEEG